MDVEKRTLRPSPSQLQITLSRVFIHTHTHSPAHTRMPPCRLQHKNEVPSVVVMFFDLEWQAEDWSTREAECAELINGIRCVLSL